MTSQTPASRGPGNGTPASARADEAARLFAVDPARNVVLEASAGTGKTSILVNRYLNLLAAGVDPANILAITFTRKAAAEMRERIVARLRRAAGESPDGAARWRDLRDRLGEVNISTIDSFCLSLLKEFPLEADLEPGFEMADDTESLRLEEESLDRALRAGRRLASADPDVRLALGSLGEAKVRAAIEALLKRRLVTLGALKRYLRSTPAALTAGTAEAALVARLAGAFDASAGGIDRFIATGPGADAGFRLLGDDLRAIAAGRSGPTLGGAIARLRSHFLTGKGEPRKKPSHLKSEFATAADYREHGRTIAEAAPGVVDAFDAFGRDLNVVLARGVGRMFRIAARIHVRALESHGLIDFTEGLARTLRLLGQMDEFARSRYRLESRYHHVLVDEFQDTSRAQWRLVARLIESWGEGAGLAASTGLDPTIFVVGDRKQSIYGFRDADVRVMPHAGRIIEGLRPDRDARRSIRHSFRAVPTLLAFTNDLFDRVEVAAARRDGFRYRASDRFPVDQEASAGVDALGIVAAASAQASAAGVAAEIGRLLAGATIRDRDTGVRREASPGDIAILFRTRSGHRDFEQALEERGIPSYVYKGLGFFDADEVRDLLALARWLADPRSDIRAAALLRSRLVRLSDDGLRRLGASAAAALADPSGAPLAEALDAEDRRVFELTRASVARWLGLVDRVPPADLIDRILDETAYAMETRGGRRVQAAENIKKFRGLVRRSQNRGYATMARLARHLDRVSYSDEGNAVIDAADAVNLMTIHAAKGLEFPVVFVVNVGRGSGSSRDPVVVERQGPGAPPLVAIGPAAASARGLVTAREREETKRLCYVAITRARDRLYFAGHLDAKGGFRPAPASLAQVLPASFRDLFPAAAAATTGATVEWAPEGGGRYPFTVCGEEAAARVEAMGEASGVPAARAALAGSLPINRFEPVPARVEALRVAVTSLASRAGGPGGGEDQSGDGDAHIPPLAPIGPRSPEATLVGTLVHALFERLAREDELPDEATLVSLATERSGSEDLTGVTDPARLVASAVRLFLDMHGQLARHASTAVGRRLHEVPFSLRVPADERARWAIPAALPFEAGTLAVRGTIDCLVLRPDGAITVVDFKTGAPRDEDERQLAIYAEAVRSMFPGRRVEGLIIRPTRQRNRDGEASV